VGERAYGAVSTDSRTLVPGHCSSPCAVRISTAREFVAAAAAARGAVGARGRPGAAAAALPQIVVPDTLRAACSSWRPAWRNEFAIPLVGGRGQQRQDHGQGNDRGHPVAHGRLHGDAGQLEQSHRRAADADAPRDAHRSAVVEMGANRIGDVAELVTLARPTVGLITNAGAEHFEGFGDHGRRGARARARWWRGSKSSATAIINADDAYAGYWRGVASAQRVVTFGVQGRRRISGEAMRPVHRKGRVRDALHVGVPLGRA
jgi:UDP-N-acetylmuramoyl-tripeptide--D-alanyl-D-alanine ligase